MSKIIQDVNNLIEEGEILNKVFDTGVKFVSNRIRGLSGFAANIGTKLAARPLNSKLNPLHYTPNQKERAKIANELRAARKEKNGELISQLKEKADKTRSEADKNKAIHIFSKKYQQARNSPDSLFNATAPKISEKISQMGNEFGTHYSNIVNEKPDIGRGDAVKQAAGKVAKSYSASSIASGIGDLLNTKVNKEVPRKMSWGEKAILGTGAIATGIGSKVAYDDYQNQKEAPKKILLGAIGAGTLGATAGRLSSNNKLDLFKKQKYRER